MKLSRLLIFFSIGILSGLVVLFLYTLKIDFLNAIDMKLNDTRFKLRDEVKPDERVVVVAIDSKSINELGRWPWDRRIIARLVENLKSYGARTVALDIVFSEQSNPESDRVLSTVIAGSRNVIAGYFFRHDVEETPYAQAELLQPSKIKIIRIEEDVKKIPIITFPYVETNIPAISKSSTGSGFFNITPDKDGILRTSNLIMLYNGDVYPSLTLSALRHYLGSEIILDIASYGVGGLTIGNKKIPVDESGRLTLNYYGKQGLFKTVSAVDVIMNRLDNNSLKDALVFVGVTEIGIGDLRATPVDPVLPGVEIHATIAGNVLQDRYLIRDGLVIGIEIFSMMFFPVISTIFLGFSRKTVIALLLFFITLGIYFFANYLLFKNYLLNTTMLLPILSITLSYLSSEAYRNLIEERQSRFLKKALSSYVSAELVTEIIKNPEILKLGGEKREVTILFSDIRDFTTISGRLSPENLVLLLNKYFSPMTQTILKHHGTLDKYIGDAIMAIYNAPLSVEDHPLVACKTALEMIEKLNEINDTFRREGLPEIDIGIGINTGDVIVGNMGTQVRFDYTAIGDTVNLASRLEGLNKIYGTHIIVSEFACKRVKELTGNSGFKIQDSRFKAKLITHHSSLSFRELDLIKVKGKDKPVIIYELSARMDALLIKKFEEALSLYRNHRFKEAQEVFQRLAIEYKDKPSKVFVKRANLRVAAKANLYVAS